VLSTLDLYPQPVPPWDMVKRSRGDTRHLKQRGRGWYFVIKTPIAARGKLHKEKVVLSLHTQSLREAQAKRPALEHQWQQAFERASRGAALTGSEVEEASREVYLGLLGRLEHDAQRGRVTAEDVGVYQDHAIEDLENANWGLSGQR
jgi:hypothetical protein